MNIKRLGLFLLIILLISLNNSIYALDEKDYNDTIGCVRPGCWKPGTGSDAESKLSDVLTFGRSA